LRSFCLQAATVLVILFLAIAPGALAGTSVRASVETFRSLQLETTGEISAEGSHPWRAAIDADRSGAVSTEELSVFVSVLDALVANSSIDELGAYGATWARENASGAAPFTLEGRAVLAEFAHSLAGPMRVAVSLDGVPGAIDRVQSSFTGLTGAVADNRTVEAVQVVTYVFARSSSSTGVHRVELSLPAMVPLRLSVGGGLEVVTFESLDNGLIDGGRTTVSGNTTEFPAVFFVRPRAVTDDAFMIALLAILAPAVLVGIVAVFASPRIEIKDAPLPVEPRYK